MENDRSTSGGVGRVRTTVVVTAVIISINPPLQIFSCYVLFY
jgi:hypothetical protein